MEPMKIALSQARWRNLSILSGTFFLLLFTFGAKAPDFGGAPGLFQPADPPAVSSPGAQALRTRWVRLPQDVLDRVPTLCRKPGSDPGFQLDLFDDVHCPWTVQRIWMRPGGGWVVWGKLTGKDEGQVVMARRGAALAATVWIPGRGRYVVEPLAGGLHRVSETDPKGGFQCGSRQPEESLIVEGVPALYQQDVHSGCPGSLNLKIRHLMVLYTPAARVDSGGTDGILAKIDAAWAGTNMAFYNSSV